MEETRTIRLKGDKGLWIIAIVFAMISVASVFSASSFLARDGGVSKTLVFLRQIMSVMLGLGVMFLCYLVPTRYYKFFAFALFGLSFLGLCLLFSPLKYEVNGAVRGIKIGPITIQAFEVAKIGIILYLAKAIDLWEYRLFTFKDFFIRLALPIFAVCLLVLCNSFSSALLIGFVSVLILIFMDIKWKYIFSMIGIVVLAVGMLFCIYLGVFKGHQERYDWPVVGNVFNRFETVEGRIDRHFNGEEIDPATMTEEQYKEWVDDHRQELNAKIAIHEGGLFGKGAGKSTQRFYLSMAFSDFIYAFIVEEYGLVGGIFVIALYLIFLLRCLRISSGCNTSFAGALIVGIAFLYATQAMLHILVNVGILPITGHTLPLISHGGSAYIILGGAYGIVLSVSKRQQEIAEERQKQQTVENQTLGNYEE